MFKLILSSVLIAYCAAEAGGYGGGSAGGYGGSGGGGYGGGVVPAAIHTRHTVDFKDVPSSGHVAPTTIEVGSSQIPLNVLFRSSSSNINVQQVHEGGHGDTQHSQSEDEPHHLRHEVTKPIIQEVREVITPYRRIVQEINPVQEEIQTIVARGTGQQNLGGGGTIGSAGGLGGLGAGALGLGGKGGGGGGYGGITISKGGSSGGYGGSSGKSAGY